MLRFLIAVVAVPLGLDLYMPVPVDNPMTAEKIALGRELFNDRRLSRDGSTACASCHDSARAFSTADSISPGVFGRRGRRNAPALVNRGWGRSFFWDGRTATLEEQVVRPIEDPNELDSSVETAAARTGVAARDISRALATYVRSLMSGDSPFDRFVNGDRTALSPEAQQGLQIFRGKANCAACHIGPNFTDEKFHNTGIAWVEATTSFRDEGRAGISGKFEDRGSFKTPTLREVARTAPYMHDGSIASLEQVVEYYDRGGNRHALLDEEIRPLGLTSMDQRAMVAFLQSLTGMLTR